MKQQGFRVDVADALRNTGAKSLNFSNIGKDTYWLIAPKTGTPVVILYRGGSTNPIKLGTWQDFSARLLNGSDETMKQAVLKANRWLS